MMCRIPVGVALGALLASTTCFTPLSATAQTAAPTPPQTPAPSAPPAPAKPDADKAKADNKAMGAYKAFFDAKLAGLHAGLELTPDQAALWTPVEAAIRDLAKAHAMAHRERGDEADGSSLEQLKRTSERLIRSGQAMKALADATGPLLATLSDDQKERLPTLLDGMQPKKVLAKAFNLPEEHDGDRRERDADSGYRAERHRHRNDADEGRGPYHSFDDRGGDREDGERAFRGRRFGNRDSEHHESGEGFYRDHEKAWGHDREAERHHGDRDERDGDRGGLGDFRHRSDSDDERT